VLLKNNIFKNLLDFLYPNLCLHCLKKLEKKYFYFCTCCLEDFYFLNSNPLLNYSAVFENEKAILTLLHEMKNQKMFSLNKIVAAFMVIQLCRLKWDMPDVIYPMIKTNINMSHSFFSKNYISELSKEVAKFFNRPIRKTTQKDTVLLIDDTLNIEKFEKIKNKTLYKKIYAIGLCFDIFFDDLNLSE